MGSKLKCEYVITVIVLLLVTTLIFTACVSSAPPEPSDTDQPVVIFAIGQEDKSDSEFRSSGLSGIKEYRCRVGVDCSTETFPAYLNRAGYSGYDYGGVERIIISFRLDQTYNDVTLRLARGGDETTVVIVDGKQTHLVTNTMLGSGEGYRIGIYNLTLGALKKGRHTIEMTVADDGKGNAVYQWDALALFAE
jgi:hypothetical protein